MLFWLPCYFQASNEKTALTPKIRQTGGRFRARLLEREAALTEATATELTVTEAGDLLVGWYSESEGTMGNLRVQFPTHLPPPQFFNVATPKK